MATLVEQVAKQSQIIAAMTKKVLALEEHSNAMAQALSELASRPRSVLEEIDAYPGRRIESVLAQEITFTADDEGTRGQPLIFQVNQDGPFVMTHYPLVLWRPSAPSNCDNFGKWRPVTSFPLPTQQFTTDFIDLMYELMDGGSQRNFQNGPRGPIFSRPDAIMPCPLPTVFPSNSAIQFTPTYNSIDFAGSEVATTQGTLHVDLIGYRIVNL